MRTISFFSAKGGTGKTTFNMLLASWLKYEKGMRVAVLDFDSPEFNLSYTRQRELKYLQDNNRAPEETLLYPILEVEDYDSRKSLPVVRELIADAAKSMDYLILDFGGSFNDGDPILDLIPENLIDLVVVPLEMDGMILSSGKSLAGVLEELGQKTLLFFNKVHGKEKPQLYADLEAWLGEAGLRVSPHRIKNTVKLRRDADNGSNFLRSTVGFPGKEMQEINPEIIRLFEEVSDYGGD